MTVSWLSSLARIEQRTRELRARCRAEFQLAFGRPWEAWMAAAFTGGDDDVRAARRTGSELLDELRRWTGGAERFISRCELPYDDAEAVGLPIRCALDQLRRLDIASDLPPIWRDRSRAKRGHLAQRIASGDLVANRRVPSGRDLALVSLLAGVRRTDADHKPQR